MAELGANLYHFTQSKNWAIINLNNVDNNIAKQTNSTMNMETLLVI